MKDLMGIFNTFNREIKGITYTGVMPVVGNIIYRKYYSSTFYYKIINIDWNEGILTLEKLDPLALGQKAYAMFQSKGKKDKGKFCFATILPNGKFYCWKSKDVVYKEGHIMHITNKSNFE